MDVKTKGRYFLEPNIGKRRRILSHMLYVTDLKRPSEEIDAQLLQLKSEGWEIIGEQVVLRDPSYDGKGGGRYRLSLGRWESSLEPEEVDEDDAEHDEYRLGFSDE